MEYSTDLAGYLTEKPHSNQQPELNLKNLSDCFRRHNIIAEGESPPKASVPPDTTMNLLATVDAASGTPVKVAAVPIRESYKGTWKNKKKMPKIVNAFNPVCPHCNYQTINIKDWNHHYTSCTLKYSK